MNEPCEMTGCRGYYVFECDAEGHAPYEIQAIDCGCSCGAQPGNDDGAAIRFVRDLESYGGDGSLPFRTLECLAVLLGDEDLAQIQAIHQRNYGE